VIIRNLLPEVIQSFHNNIINIKLIEVLLSIFTKRKQIIASKIYGKTDMKKLLQSPKSKVYPKSVQRLCLIKLKE